VLERVVEVGLRHLDVDPNAAFRELFDGRLHSRPLCQKGPELPGSHSPLGGVGDFNCETHHRYRV
jgi:hypothetical protein